MVINLETPLVTRIQLGRELKKAIRNENIPLLVSLLEESEESYKLYVQDRGKIFGILKKRGQCRLN